LPFVFILTHFPEPSTDDEAHSAITRADFSSLECSLIVRVNSVSLKIWPFLFTKGKTDTLRWLVPAEIPAVEDNFSAESMVSGKILEGSMIGSKLENT
jgi:hypothetical protein